nr:immunoglobulin heavy chain junction region [Mus musculus]MBK4185273.1 immunoglobulin heavy chain junction region [Mus musculus]MBK4185274.1 immunoglobulin heavy chain junction region [Mus musculus]MBK4185275.1 immunoglobulin heavy chain junction region [Mus musculus]
CAREFGGSSPFDYW